MIQIGKKDVTNHFFDDSHHVLTHAPYRAQVIKVFYSSEKILGIQVYYWSYKSQKLIKASAHK